MRLSRAMSVAAVLIGVAALAVFAAYWLAPDLTARLAADHLSSQTEQNTAAPGLAAALIVSLLVLAAAEWGAWSALRLFRSWGEGNPHPPEAGRHVRNMGAALMALALLKVLGSIVVSVAMTLDWAPGTREVGIAVGLEELVIGLTGVVLVAIGLALTDASAIADENRQFV